MYHCHIHFYFIGHSYEIFEMIKKMPSCEHFFHEFSQSDVPEEELLKKADVILADIQGENAEETVHELIAHKKEKSELIIIAEKNQMSLFSDVFSKIEDIWIFPMSEEELKFRFSKWQQEFKNKKDFWQVSQYLETTINNIPNLIWYKDKEGIHEKVNDSFCKTVNKRKEQVEGRDHYYIWDVDPNDPANEGYDCMESDFEVIRAKKTCVTEETVKSGDEIKLLKTYKSPLYDLDGTVMGTVGVGIDVTQERAYEQKIIEKNQALETVFATIDCGLLCHTLDGRRILRINNTALKILGFASEDELIDAGFDMISPSVLDEDKPKLRECMETLKEEGDSVSIEYRVLHKDGEILHVMGNVKLLKENNELYYQRFLLDCTAQKLQEKKNQRHQMELVQALSIDYSLVCYFDLDTGKGMLLRVDDESNCMFDAVFDREISFDESMESYINTFVYEPDRKMLRQSFSQERLKIELNKRNIYYVNYRTFQRNEMKYYEMKAVRAGVWDDSHGIVLGFRSVDEETRNEMKKKKLLEDALIQANKANKAKSTFLSNMSHDIRTPMNAIVGFTSLAASHIDSKEQVQEYLSKIMTSGNHLLNLINDVLDMSRIESGKMQLEEAPCVLSDILYGLNSIVQADVRAKHLEMHIDISGITDDEVYCDKLRLNQVLLNIVSNSIKYTNEGGSIYLSVVQKAQAVTGYAYYEFCIRDTGIGMSREFVSHIFEPFEREKNTTTSGIEGTGLGMAITKNIVDMMNGAIDVKSEPDKGTEIILSFTFRLNVQTDNYAVAELKNRRALIVDADSNNCVNVSQLLEKLGMRVEYTVSGEEAIVCVENALRQKDGYRLYLLDRMLPDMNVLEVIRKIHQKSDENSWIIVLTEYDWSDIEFEAKEAGVTAFCRKPLFLPELRNCLCSIACADAEKDGDKLAQFTKNHNGCILLAEDNELNQEIAVAILEDAGFYTEIAENGQIAVDMIKNSKPGYYELVLMDVQMPVMNGYEAAKAIRGLENKQLASIPILAMTANAFEEDRQKALRCGMNGHVAKPIDVKKLFDTMSKLLS